MNREIPKQLKTSIELANEGPTELEKKWEREHLGENVTIHSVFTRHGEKIHDINNPETDLSPDGEISSFREGKKRKKVDAIKGYNSDTPRTDGTTTFMVEGSPTEKKMEQRVRDDLGVRYNPDGEFFIKLKKKKKEILGDDYDKLPPKERAERLEEYNNISTDYYLALGDKRPDKNTYSPVETAATMAKVLNNNIKMADKLKSKSEVDLINAAHDLNIAAFLKEVLVREVEGKKMIGFDSIKEIGGSIKFNEGFEVLIKTDDSGNKTLKILFRNQEYEIDETRLAELVEIAKELKIEDANKKAK